VAGEAAHMYSGRRVSHGRGLGSTTTVACWRAGPLDKYLESFQWNEAKYPVKNSIRDLTDLIQKVRERAPFHPGIGGTPHERTAGRTRWILSRTHSNWATSTHSLSRT